MQLFIYGSLKRGYYNNRRFLQGQKFVCEAETLPEYKLFSCKYYPFLTRSMNGLAIKGEIWEVDEQTIKVLDDVENGAGYTRKPLKVKDHEEVQGYVYLGSTQGLKECGNEWVDESLKVK